jgi:hypothetical protein
MPQGISITGRRFNIDSNNPSPILDNSARQWTFQPTQDRIMYTISETKLSYTFQAPPSQFQLEGFGAEINELKRPYSLPIADITGGKLRRLSFEFAIVKKVSAATTLARRPSRFALSETTQEYLEANRNNPLLRQPVINNITANFSYFDGFSNSIEDQILRLKTIADLGIPVAFENMSPSIQENSWYIDDMKFTLNRDDATGKAVAGTCSISCIEYKQLRQRFILMPRFRYGVPDVSSKTKKGSSTNDPAAVGSLYWLRKALETQIAKNRANGLAGYPYSVSTLRGQAGIPSYIDVPDWLIKELQP